MTDLRFITLVSAQPPLRVTALRGQGAPTLVSGYGGWSVVARQRQKSLTVWDGKDPLQIDVPLILGVTPSLDHLVADTSAQHDISALEQMALQPSPGVEPPIILAIGALPHSDLVWVIPTDGLTWDPNPLYSANGYVVRQAVTVRLMEWVPETIPGQNAAQRARTAALVTAANAARAAGSAATNQPTKAKTYVVRAGDTLSAIASRLLGNYKRWPEIAALNGIRDPKSITPGMRLRLP